MRTYLRTQLVISMLAHERFDLYMYFPEIIIHRREKFTI